jgi:Tfp pilus assembly protein PilZ
MPEPARKTSPAKVREQIVRLIDRMPADMQLKLLKFLEAKLPRRIKGNLVIEKRGDLRRHCLITVDYTIRGRTYGGFILDISAFGVFIESDDPFTVGDEIRLSFYLPRQTDPFKITGNIVWSGMQGFGVKFDRLSSAQRRQIKSFSEEESRVYDIVT